MSFQHRSDVPRSCRINLISPWRYLGGDQREDIFGFNHYYQVLRLGYRTHVEPGLHANTSERFGMLKRSCASLSFPTEVAISEKMERFPLVDGRQPRSQSYRSVSVKSRRWWSGRQPSSRDAFLIGCRRLRRCVN